jgi:hypothetical protein
MERDVSQYIKQCAICQKQKGTEIKQPLTVTDTQDEPW